MPAATTIAALGHRQGAGQGLHHRPQRSPTSPRQSVPRGLEGHGYQMFLRPFRFERSNGRASRDHDKKHYRFQAPGCLCTKPVGKRESNRFRGRGGDSFEAHQTPGRQPTVRVPRGSSRKGSRSGYFIGSDQMETIMEWSSEQIGEKEVEPLKKLVTSSSARIKELEQELATAEREAALTKNAAEEATSKMKDVDSLARFLCQDQSTVEVFLKVFIHTDLGVKLVWTYGLEENDFPDVQALLPDEVADPGPKPYFDSAGRQTIDP
nr:serine/arginine repetitive matrix protein 2-like [Ipomoea batatas]